MDSIFDSEFEPRVGEEDDILDDFFSQTSVSTAVVKAVPEHVNSTNVNNVMTVGMFNDTMREIVNSTSMAIVSLNQHLQTLSNATTESLTRQKALETKCETLQSKCDTLESKCETLFEELDAVRELVGKKRARSPSVEQRSTRKVISTDLNPFAGTLIKMLLNYGFHDGARVAVHHQDGHIDCLAISVKLLQWLYMRVTNQRTNISMRMLIDAFPMQKFVDVDVRNTFVKQFKGIATLSNTPRHWIILEYEHVKRCFQSGTVIVPKGDLSVHPREACNKWGVPYVLEVDIQDLIDDLITHV